MQTKKPLILELRIPYGIRPIKYVGGEQLVGSNAEKNAYLEALMREVLTYEGQLEDYEILAVRLSGGASAVMSPDMLGQLLNLVRTKLPVARGAEVSYDTLPNTVCTPALSGISAGKPNRVELMMRSYLDSDLKTLDAPFTVQDIKNAVLYFAKFHVNNFGMTVNYGIPGQSLQDFEYTVKSCANMNAGHITIEQVSADEVDGAPTAGESLAMYNSAVEILTARGYENYSRGLFCLPGHGSVYELLKAEGCEYAGLGLNARSLYDGVYTRNTNNLHIYMLHSDDPEKLTAEAYAVSEG